MLLLHLSPLNADNIPWRIEYIELDLSDSSDTELFSSLKKTPRAKSITVTPPAGVYPSPVFAVQAGFDMGDALLYEAESTENACAKLRLVLDKHQDLIFTDERSIALFFALELRLLINDMLMGKNVVILQNLITAAKLFKNEWPQLKGDLSSIANYIYTTLIQQATSPTTNNNESFSSILSNTKASNKLELIKDKLQAQNSLHTAPHTALDCATIIYLYLYKKWPQLCKYYTIPQLPLQASSMPPKAKLKLWLAVRAQEMRLIVPLNVLNNKVYAFDISFEPTDEKGAMLLIDNHTWILSPASLVTNDILQSLNLTASLVQKRLEDLATRIAVQDNLIQILDIALSKNPRETAFTAPLTNARALGLRAEFRLHHHTYQTISACNGEAFALKKMLPVLKGVYRNMVMDYLASINIELLNEPFRQSFLETARSRELYGREAFSRELNELSNQPLSPRAQNLIKRLCSAIEQIMNG